MSELPGSLGRDATVSPSAAALRAAAAARALARPFGAGRTERLAEALLRVEHEEADDARATAAEIRTLIDEFSEPRRVIDCTMWEGDRLQFLVVAATALMRDVDARAPKEVDLTVFDVDVDDTIDGHIVMVADVGDGRHHLRALDATLRDSIVHLVPDLPADVHDGDVRCTVDVGVLAGASLCVIVGAVNGWTAAVGRLAELHEVPLVFSELAVGVPDAPSVVALPFAAVTTSAPAERGNVAAHVGVDVDSVVVVGTPAPP